jgi:hypothetical protein
MRKEYDRVKATETFQKIVKDEGAIDLREVALGWDAEELSERFWPLELTELGVAELYDWAGHKLGESIHADYMKARVERDKVPSRMAKLEAFALSTDLQLTEELEKAAEAQVHEWLDAHKSAIGKLSAERRDLYREIRRAAPNPTSIQWDLPSSIEVGKGDHGYAKHIFVDANG